MHIEQYSCKQVMTSGDDVKILFLTTEGLFPISLVFEGATVKNISL